MCVCRCAVTVLCGILCLPRSWSGDVTAGVVWCDVTDPVGRSAKLNHPSAELEKKMATVWCNEVRAGVISTRAGWVYNITGLPVVSNIGYNTVIE